MLTKDEAQFYWEGDRVEPDRLKTQTHAHYPFLAAQLLEIYQNGAGKMRSELWEAVRGVFHAEADCPSRRIQAFCSLLDEKSDFGGRVGADVARKRMRIFELAAARHPLVRVGYLGDYDPAGLAIFQEVVLSARPDARFLMPDNLPELLKSGDHSRFHKQESILKRLVSSTHPDITLALSAITAARKGLDQEAITNGTLALMPPEEAE